MLWCSSLLDGCHRGRDLMMVGFTTTYAISAYHHWHYEFEYRSGEMYSIQLYVIKFVNDLRQVNGFLQIFRHDIAKILLKVALKTITLNHNLPDKSYSLFLKIPAKWTCYTISRLIWNQADQQNKIRRTDTTEIK